MISKNSALLLATILMSATTSFAAAPLASCVASDMVKIRALIEQDSKATVFGTALAPAVAYEGLNQAQVVFSNSNGAGLHNHVNEVDAKLKAAVNEFIASKGDPSQTAAAVMGDANRRQVLQILRRPKGQPAIGANAQSKCDAKSCEDMAVKTQMLYVLNNSSVAKAVDTLADYKFETTGSVDVFFCEASASCHARAHLMKAGGEVQKTSNPAPMKPNTPYMLRATAMGSETTSVYRVHPVSICGKQATLMTGILAKDANAFDSASTVALAVESDSRVLLFAHYQGYVAGGRGKVPGWMLGGGIVGSIARSTLNGIYNKQGERLGASERINGKGLLK